MVESSILESTSARRASTSGCRSSPSTFWPGAQLPPASSQHRQPRPRRQQGPDRRWQPYLRPPQRPNRRRQPRPRRPQGPNRRRQPRPRRPQGPDRRRYPCQAATAGVKSTLTALFVATSAASGPEQQHRYAAASGPEQQHASTVTHVPIQNAHGDATSASAAAGGQEEEEEVARPAGRRRMPPRILRRTGIWRTL